MSQTDRETLLSLIDSGVDLVPLKHGQKAPRDNEWTTRIYSRTELRRAVEQGAGLGVRIGKSERVLDVDPRRDPHGRSADAVLEDLEMAFGCDLSNARRVRTGSNGLHVYLTANGVLHRERLPGDEWAAIELKSHGRQVVAPGSLHPSGNLYRLENAAPPIPLPASLSAALVRGRTESVPGETISPAHLKRLLDQLDPCDYTDGRDEWLKILLEVHAASGGSPEGFDLFCEWSARDEDWPPDPDSWLAQWERLHGNRAGDRTVASLYQRVLQAGGNPAPPAVDDFEELPPLEPTAERRPALLVPFDEEALPRFPWLVEGLLAYGVLTTTIAKGGTGKSLLTLHFSRMVAAGTAWAFWEAKRAAKVLLVTAEDDVIEQQRRFAAICFQSGARVNDVAGMIAIETAEPLLIRALGASTPRRTAFYDYLVETVRRDNYEVVIFDPLMSFGRGLDENSNDDRHLMATTLRELAAATGTCVHAVQHATKGSKNDQDAGRGGSAFIDATRAALILNEMNDDEAKQLLPDNLRSEQWRYVKVTLAKANYSKKFSGQKWFEKKSVSIANGEERPALEPWEPIGLVEPLNDEALTLVLGLVARSSAKSPHDLSTLSVAVKETIHCSLEEARAHVSNLIAAGKIREERTATGKRVKIELHLPYEAISDDEWEGK